LRCALAVDPRDRDRRLARPFGRTRRAIRTPSVVPRSGQVALAVQTASAFVFECARNLAHRSRLGAAAPVRQHGFAECSSTSVPGPIRLAALRAPERAMRRTDFCLLTSSYEHPRLVGSQCVTRFRYAHSGDRLSHVSAIHFGGPRAFVDHRVGCVVPVAALATAPLASLSPLPRARMPLARHSLA